MSGNSRQAHQGGFGLRSRIALSVALVSLVLSSAVSLTVYTVARQVLLDAREEDASTRALKNASVVLAKRDLAQAEPSDMLTALSGLSDTSNPVVIWDSGARSQALNPNRFDADDLPGALRDRALVDEETAIMRFDATDGMKVGVAVPMPSQRAAYFEATPLGDISNALSSIRFALFGTVVASTILAGLLGSWASRYTIRPLTRVANAAQLVALGELDTRINYDEFRNDPDLEPLVANFNEMVRALQHRINRDARFASDVSHELRSPLTTLNAGLQVLENKRADMPERAQQALDLLKSDVDRFTQLVEDLLEISRFDAGAVRLELDDVAITTLVRNTVAALADSEIPVIAEPDTEDLVIACDKRRLARILVNFVNNADKYADGPTHVSVSLHDPDPDDPLAERTVRIGVEDAGAGVPQESRDAVFDRFNRGDQAGARGSDIGVGLGLALAAEHARLQAGRVWVEDRVDGGSGARFVVELPVLQLRDEDSDPDDLSVASPASTSNLTMTGEHRAVPVSESRGTTP